MPLVPDEDDDVERKERSSFPLKCAHGNETNAAGLENIIGSRIGQCTDSRTAERILLLANQLLRQPTTCEGERPA